MLRIIVSQLSTILQNSLLNCSASRMRKKARVSLPDNTVLNFFLILFRKQTFPKIIQIALLEALEKSGIKILFLDEEGYSIVLEILKKYSDRKLSFTDASLVYILENYGIENMASYDERSFFRASSQNTRQKLCQYPIKRRS